MKVRQKTCFHGGRFGYFFSVDEAVGEHGFWKVSWLSICLGGIKSLVILPGDCEVRELRHVNTTH